jgi:hypothetical protein
MPRPERGLDVQCRYSARAGRSAFALNDAIDRHR